MRAKKVTMTKNLLLDLLLLSLILVALVALTLLSPPIGHHGEAREGLVVQDIVENAHWILPDRNGELPSKPPLFHWMAAGLALLFGLSDATIRLPSAIAGWFLALVTFIMGRGIGGRKTAWLATGVLLGTYLFWDAGTEARVDMVFAACVTAAIAGFFLWYRDGDGLGHAVCYLAAACGVLAKGPAGIALPASVALGFLATERRLDVLKRFWSWPLMAIVLVIDLGWYALAAQIGGKEFLVKQILHENVDQFLGIGGFSTHKARFAMAVWFLSHLFPWNLALVWALVRRLRGEREDSSGRFLHAWWIIIFAIFFLAAGRRAVYLLPLYPAIALIAGRAIAAAIEEAQVAPSLSGVRKASSGFRWLVTPTVVRSLTIVIVIFDLCQIAVNPIARRYERREQRTAQVSFADKISTSVPRDAPLYADAHFPETNLWITSYRLQREISRRPMTCAGRDYYFLSLIGPGESIQRTDEILATLEIDRKILALRLVPKEMVCPK